MNIAMRDALIISTLVFSLIVIITMAKNKLAFYHPLFLLFIWHFLGYIIFPWDLYLNNKFYMLNWYGVPLQDDTYLVRTLFFINLGFIMVVLGYFLPFGRNIVKHLYTPAIPLDTKISFITTLFFLILVTYALFNPATMVSDAKGGTIYSGTTGYIALSYFFFSGVLLVLYYHKYHEGGDWALFFY